MHRPAAFDLAFELIFDTRPAALDMAFELMFDTRPAAFDLLGGLRNS